VRKCLEKDGFVAINAIGSEIGAFRSDWAIYYNTIKAAGFETIVPYLSLLEGYNPKLYEKVIEEPTVTRQIAAERVWYMVRGLRSQFIMMKSEDSEINMEYKDYGIEMYVLNEERYKLTFNIFHYLPETADRSKIDVMPERVDWSKVNSITRPALPSASPFTVKAP